MAAPDTTPVTGVPPASPIPIVTFPTSPAITVALRPIPVASVRLANLVLRRQTRPAAPMGRNPVLTAAAVPDCVVKGIPTVTAVPAGTSLQAVHPLRFRLGQLQKFALAALLPAPAISARVALSQTKVLATSLLAVTMAL